MLFYCFNFLETGFQGTQAGLKLLVFLPLLPSQGLVSQACTSMPSLQIVIFIYLYVCYGSRVCECEYHVTWHSHVIRHVTHIGAEVRDQVVGASWGLNSGSKT